MAAPVAILSMLLSCNLECPYGRFHRTAQFPTSFESTAHLGINEDFPQLRDATVEIDDDLVIVSGVNDEDGEPYEWHFRIVDPDVSR